MKFTIYSLTLFFALLSLNSISAQNEGKYKIIGQIKDSVTNNEIAFATVSLYNPTNDSLITGTITDEQGRFIIEKLPKATYNLVISAIAYTKKAVKAIHSSDNKNILNVGTIYIVLDIKTLDEVVVLEDRKMIELKADRKIVHIDNAIAASGGSAVDALLIVPEFKEDNGIVTLKNQSFTVLVNGKPAGLSADQLSTVPASLIDRIEVITNPSVKYNPEGVGGIVNIITKKQKPGLNALVQASGGSDNSYHSAGTINYRIKKLNFFVAANANYYGGISDGYLDRDVYTISNLHEDFENQQKFWRYNYKIGFDFDLDSNNLFTFFWSQPNDRGHNINQINSINKYGQDTEINHSEILNDLGYQQNYFAFNYKHLFNKKGAEINFDINYNFSTNWSKYQPFIESATIGIDDSKFKLTPDASINAAEFKMDYTLPISEKILIESGLNGSVNEEINNNSGATFNFSTATWTDSTTIKNSFKYTENLIGAYILSTFTFDKISFQIGTRLEYTNTLTELTNTNEKTNREYIDFFPSASISYSPSEKIDLNLSYSRRIERPMAFQLNPFVYNGDFLTERFIGNPFLKPTYTNSIEFGISQNWDKVSINTGLSYMSGNGIIDNYFYIEDGIKYKSLSNVSGYQNYMANSSLNLKIIKWVKTTISGSIYQDTYQMDNNDGGSKHDYWGYDFRCILQFSLKKDFFISPSLIYYGPANYYSWRRDDIFRLSLTAKKTFNKHFIVSLRIYDILNSKFIVNSWSDEFTSKTVTNSHNSAVYIGFMYKFGKDIKTRARTNLNSDLNLQRN